MNNKTIIMLSQLSPLVVMAVSTHGVAATGLNQSGAKCDKRDKKDCLYDHSLLRVLWRVLSFGRVADMPTRQRTFYGGEMD